MSSSTKHYLIGFVAFCIALALHVTAEDVIQEEDKKPEIAAQHDQQFVQRQQPYYGAGPYGQNFGGDSNVNFDFQCKCKAKSNLANLQIPTDANQAAQQQVQELQNQIRRMQEQIRRAQQGQTPFEQFAQMLSTADGLDCNCSGVSSPFSNFPLGPSGGGFQGMGGGSQQGYPFGGRMPFGYGGAGRMMPPQFGGGPMYP